MVQVAVIADDLTGANATGVQLIKHHLKVYSLINGDKENLENITDCDCIVYPTNSRGLDGEAAYAKVYHGTNLLKSPHIKLYSKRIDSTLRGNIGKETDAILDALANDAIALVVPCFPEAGRISRDGRLFVNGIPLHHTEAATDPKNPIDTDIIADIFAKQTKYKTASIYAESLAQGVESLGTLIAKEKNAGIRILIFDAATAKDLDLIAQAAIASKVDFIAVDPGVFTAALCRYLIPVSTQKKKVLVVVGSTNAVAADQAINFLQTQECYNVFINVEAFLQNETARKDEINRVAFEILNNRETHRISSIIGSGIYPKHRINLESYTHTSADNISTVINESIAEIAYQILSADHSFKGLYTSGGDISLAVCNRLNAFGMHLHKEVVPLASFGELKGGAFEGLKYITKGGMVGDTDALNTCVNFLLQTLDI